MLRDGRPATGSLSIAVLCWDLGHNGLARAHLLADMLSAEHDVQIVGFHFPEFGADVWAPLRDSPLPIRRYPGGDFPEHLVTMERVVRDLTADVVYVVKPRLPGLGVGLLAKADDGRALVVDCDDLELSFVGGSAAIPPGDLARLRDHPDFLRPHGRIWTGFSDWAVRFADAVTVANVPLAARYGGSVIPHARDERTFDPARYDRDAARARVGLHTGDRMVLFGGTPRRHKSLHRLASALERIGDPRNRLCVLATPELDELRPHLAGLERWIQPVPPQPFAALPQLLAAADVACVLQDRSSPTVRWQTPAKVTDALAMGVPCLATPTPPLLPLVDEGGLVAVSEHDLADQLGRMLDDPAGRAAQARRGREIFLKRFSYSAVRPQLERVLHQAASGSRPPSADLRSIVSFQRSVFGGAAHDTAARARNTEVQRVRAAVGSKVPPGSGPIAVVSRGDDELISFDTHVGWHFPRTDEGAYAGYYPEDSDAAIQHLEEVRRRGARYLVIPTSSSWWLDHYAGFRDHLMSNYHVLAPGDGVSALVELAPETPIGGLAGLPPAQLRPRGGE